MIKIKEINEHAKQHIVELFLNEGFTYEDIEGISSIKDILNMFDEYIARSKNEKIGFKRYVLSNLDGKEFEWQSDNFHNCLFKKCIWCDEHNGYCKFYEDYLNEISDSDVFSCSREV